MSRHRAGVSTVSRRDVHLIAPGCPPIEAPNARARESVTVSGGPGGTPGHRDTGHGRASARPAATAAPGFGAVGHEGGAVPVVHGQRGPRSAPGAARSGPTLAGGPTGAAVRLARSQVAWRGEGLEKGGPAGRGGPARGAAQGEARQRIRRGRGPLHPQHGPSLGRKRPRKPAATASGAPSRAFAIKCQHAYHILARKYILVVCFVRPIIRLRAYLGRCVGERRMISSITDAEP